MKAVVWLMEQGYEVFRNLSAEGAFDMIALSPEETIYIDVKTASEVMDYGVKNLTAAKFRPSAKKYPELNKKIVYVYKDQVAWRLFDLVVEK